MNVGQLIARIDERHGVIWDIWRDQTGWWKVKVPGHTVRCSTLESALERACAPDLLPVVPPRPIVLDLSQYSVEPSEDHSYALVRNGQPIGYFMGGVAAMNEAKRQVRASLDAAECWDKRYGAITSGVEGIDYLWEVKASPAFVPTDPPNDSTHAARPT